jgi:predicted flavoprotein YhiN
VLAETTRARGPRSLATHLKSRLGIQGLKLALLHEVLGSQRMHDAAQLAAALKALPLELAAPRPLAEAISTAGGVRLDALDERLMLHAMPGVFCAGEMLDWEAPTGGYLLTACMATGRAAGLGLLAWWTERRHAATRS